MSIDATRTSSSFVETSSSWLVSAYVVSSSTSFLRATSALSGSNSSRIWVMAALGLSVYGYRICSNALKLLKVGVFWIQLFRRLRLQGRDDGGNDVHLPDTRKRILEGRKLQIKEALHTKTYGHLQKHIYQNSSGQKDANDEIEKNQQTKEQKDNLCLSSSSSYEPPADEVISPPTSTSKTILLQPSFGKTCVICLEDFEQNDRISFSKNSCGDGCMHIFHTECLHAWLEKHTSCPTCRHRILPDAEPMHSESIPWVLMPSIRR